MLKKSWNVHYDIYDFCIMAKVRNPFYIAEVNGDKEIIHKKLVRYFVSNTGSQLFKRGQNKNEKEVNNHVNAPMDYIGNIYVTYFNNYYESEDYNILDIIAETLDGGIESIKKRVKIYE